MESRVFKIGMLVLLLLLNGCSDSVTGPGSSAPLLFPLAQGASWEYSITSKSSSERSGQTSYSRASSSEYCTAQIEVTRAIYKQLESEYVLAVNFIIDSLHVQIKDNYMDSSFDTTYTMLNVVDTSYTVTLVVKDFVVHYEKDSILEHFLPLIPERGTKVNLKLFNFGYLTYFGSDLSYDLRSNENSFIFDKSGMPFIEAIFKPANGGLTKLTYDYYEGDIHHKERHIELNLLSYNPGK